MALSGELLKWNDEANGLTITEIVALASVLISIGANIGLYVHLSSVMNGRFDSVDRRFDAVYQRFDAVDRRFDAVDRKFDSMERRLELIQGDTHNMDIRLTKLER